MNDLRRVSALTIAGSDSGGGAGIQADLKTFAAHGVHGLSAITALTAQHTRGVPSVFVPPVAFLQAQIDACFDDFRIGAVKIGMLATADVIHAVANSIARHAPTVLILDPVMIATSGATLLADDALDALRTRLLPLASLLTPNIPEAAMLAGMSIRSGADAETAIATLHRQGAQAILLKGGHLDEGDAVVDRYSDGTTTIHFSHTRLPVDAHGTGCTLASAIAARRCLGDSLPDACRHAGDYVFGALRAGYRPGRSSVVVLDQAGPPPWMHPRNKKAGD